MRYGVTFVFLAMALFAGVVFYGGWYWLGAWPAVSFLLVGLGYLGLGPGVFGKRPDGMFAPWSWILLAPYLLLTISVWHLVRIMSRERCCDEVAPGVFLGRRPCAGEIPEQVTLVLDLTAEFPADRRAIAGRRYLSVPMLDAHTGDERALGAAIATAAMWPGAVYVHCAQGHGRSACVVAAILIRRKLATDSVAAIRNLQTCRPGVALNRLQHALLKQICRLST